MASSAKKHVLYALTGLLISTLLMACGSNMSGMASTSSAPAPTNPSISSVSASCTPSTLAPSATSQCEAKVNGSGSYNSAVKWSASAGTITASGLFTAPASGGNVTVTATSVQDPSVSSRAAVAVRSNSSSAISSVAVSCTPATLAPGAASQCEAKVQGSGNYNSAVKWSASAGAITANGLFTAPASAGNINITATSVQNAAISGAQSLTVKSSSSPTSAPSTISSVAVACSPTTLAPGATSHCNATVNGTGNYNSAVKWSASAGTITANGLFTAPNSAGNIAITAASVQNAAISGVQSLAVKSSSSSPAATVTSVAVACSPTTLAPGATSQCSAKVQGTGNYNSAVKWSASAGTITANGLFTAPASAGNIRITATSVQSPAKTASQSLSVQSSSTISSVAISCAPATVAPGATSQCSAKVQGTGSYNSAVKWSASAGAITTSGLFTAPNSAGNITITATSVQSPTRSSTYTLNVSHPATRPHVVMVMEENSEYSTVVGDGNWPNLNSLIRNGALATHYYANTHPSIGNYLMLTTGQILTNNDSSTQVWNVDNIARRMLAAGVSFRIYAEGITQGYVGGNTGPYVVRHNPFALLSDIADNHQVAMDHLFPFTQFATDLANGNLPEFSFIVPDVNDDAHDGTPQQADSWLQTKVVEPLSNDSAFQPSGNGVLIVDFDEGTDSDTTYGGGHVSPVFWGPAIKTGYTQQSTTVYQHPSMLRTIMQLLGLKNPPGAAASAPPMTEFLK